MRVHLVIHQKLPTYSMYLDDVPYSEPIETVNAEVVGVYSTYAKAEAAAAEYFFNTLGLTDHGESQNGYYYCSATHMEDFDTGTWDEEVFVMSKTVE
jgi:hypothetical protein